MTQEWDKEPGPTPASMGWRQGSGTSTLQLMPSSKPPLSLYIPSCHRAQVALALSGQFPSWRASDAQQCSSWELNLSLPPWFSFGTFSVSSQT